MPSQSDYEKVKIYLLTPLCTQFGVKRLDDLVVDGFVEELRKYSEATLIAAFSRLRREAKRMPTLAQTLEACEAEKPKNQLPGIGHIAPGRSPWEQKYDAAAKLAADYLHGYVLCDLADTAKAEGWINPLLLYVQAAAKLQAQIITGCANWGYTNVVYQFRWNDGKETIRRRINEFLSACRTQAATGNIVVTVPNEAIDAWRTQAACDRQKLSETTVAS